MTCGNCGINPPRGRDRCRPCYEYLRRTGKERPERLYRRQYRFNARPKRRPNGFRRLAEMLDISA
jgi:hypothetical protein